jgi:hypothetical protein
MWLIPFVIFSNNFTKKFITYIQRRPLSIFSIFDVKSLKSKFNFPKVYKLLESFLPKRKLLLFHKLNPSNLLIINVLHYKLGSHKKANV